MVQCMTALVHGKVVNASTGWKHHGVLCTYKMGHNVLVLWGAHSMLSRLKQKRTKMGEFGVHHNVQLVQIVPDVIK